MTYHPVLVKNEMFKDAPVTDRYPTTIYYRLLAHKLLPDNLHKILYLDADVLCINDLTRLYATDLTDYLYASAIHTGLTNTTEVINKIRLQNFDAAGYYNSGVLLMNLDAIRQRVQPAAIFNYIRDHILLLPDQDVLNALYGKDIKSVPDELYNFDTRKGQIYETISFGEWTTDWVVKNTVILHYCGRDKPWLVKKNSGRYGIIQTLLPRCPAPAPRLVDDCGAEAVLEVVKGPFIAVRGEGGNPAPGMVSW